MVKAVSIIEYLPNILREIKELKAINMAENPELETVWGALECALSDQFIADATENGVRRWEQILTILPKGTDTLDERKFRILTRLNEQLPYSYRMLLQQLETLCGKGGYMVELAAQDYTLKVQVALIAKANYEDVDALLHRITPANLVVDLSLLYNQHKTLAKHIHGQLGNYTHYYLRNEVI